MYISPLAQPQRLVIWLVTNQQFLSTSHHRRNLTLRRFLLDNACVITTPQDSNRATGASASAPAQDATLLERITPYHWLVVLIASCGWLFDCMDQRLFTLAREPALREIMGAATPDAAIKLWGSWATSSMMIGWATGGIIFGMMSDRLGRVKTMVITLLVYSGFTGLSGISRSVNEFLIYRFLVGLGVGGMFGAATTLVAESVPGRIRAVALGSLQALSACGNIVGSLISTRIQPGQADLLFGLSGWRIIFFIGILPAILVVPTLLVLREPEMWKTTKRRIKDCTDKSYRFGSIPDLFRHPVWRRNLLVGVCVGLSGMAGWWGKWFFSPGLVSTALQGAP